MYAEDFEHEEFGVLESAGWAFHGLDLVLGAFQRAGVDGMVVPGEDAVRSTFSAGLQILGESGLRRL